MKAQLGALIKKLADSQSGYLQVTHVQQTLTCDYYGGGHENGQCNLEGFQDKEANFMGIFQRNNPFSIT